MLIRTAIFASGTGTNFSAIADKVELNDGPIEIACLVCDHPDAPVIARAKGLGIPIWAHDIKKFTDKATYEQAILDFLEPLDVQLIVLAGYMKIVTDVLLQRYGGSILNIHPALLPKFPGRHGIEDAFAAGVSETGVTVHYVDNGVDTGPVIAQVPVKVLPTDDIDTLAQRIHDVEHELYFDSICKVVEEKFTSK